MEFFTLEPQQHRPHAAGPKQQHSKSTHMAAEILSSRVLRWSFRKEFTQNLLFTVRVFSVFTHLPSSYGTAWWCNDCHMSQHVTLNYECSNFELSVWGLWLLSSTVELFVIRSWVYGLITVCSSSNFSLCKYLVCWAGFCVWSCVYTCVRRIAVRRIPTAGLWRSLAEMQ